MMTGEKLPRARTFNLRAEYWRATLWGICGCVLIAITLLLVNDLVMRKPFNEVLTVVAIFCSIAAFMAQFLLPRIRIDEHGISRRILWWWDLWPWEAFADGR